MGEHNTLTSMRNIITASEVKDLSISRARAKLSLQNQLCRVFAPSKFSETPSSWKEPNPASQPPRSSLQPVSENSNLSSPCVGRITKPKAKKKRFHLARALRQYLQPIFPCRPHLGTASALLTPQLGTGNQLGRSALLPSSLQQPELRDWRRNPCSCSDDHNVI